MGAEIAVNFLQVSQLAPRYDYFVLNIKYFST